MANKQPDTTPARSAQSMEMAPPPPYWCSAPFQALQRFSDEVDRMWDDFGFTRQSAGPLWRGRSHAWDPAIDVTHKNDVLTIKADLPGLKRDEVSVELSDHAVTIQGERKREFEEERDGVFRSERSYGSFRRVVPVPEGAKSDQAKAKFRDGVLEITVPAPMAGKGRRLPIEDGTATH